MMRVAAVLALLPGAVATTGANSRGGEHSPHHSPPRNAGTSESQVEEGHAGSKNGDTWRRQYVNQYAEAYVPDVRNASDYQAWRNNFVDQYAEPYRHYVDAHDRVAERYPHVKSSPEDTHTLKELREWREAQHMMAKSYIPAEYRAFSNGAVEQEYEENKARIQKEIAAREANETDADAAEAPHSRRSRAEAWGGREPHAGAGGAAPVLLAGRADNPPEGSSDGAGGDADHGDADGEAPAEHGEQPQQPSKERKHEHKSRHEKEHRGHGEQPEQPEQPEAREAGERYGEDYGNASDYKEWRDRFVNKYASEYKKFVDAADRMSEQYKTTPIRAEDAKDLQELRRWKEAQHSEIEDYIPHEYRHFVAGAVEQDYERNKARLEKESEGEPEGKEEEEEEPKGKDEHKGEDEKGADEKGEEKKGEDEKGDEEKSHEETGDDEKGADEKGDDEKGEDEKGDDDKEEPKGDDDKGDGEKSSDEKGDGDKDGDHEDEGAGKAGSPTRFMAANLLKVGAAGGSSFAAIPSAAPLMMAAVVGALLTSSAALLSATVQRRFWRPQAEDMTEQLLRPEAPLATA